MRKPLPVVDLKTRIAAMALLLFLAAIWLVTILVVRSLKEDLEGLLAAQQYSAAAYVADDLEQRVRLRLDALTSIASEIDSPLLNDPAKLQDLLAHRPLLRLMFSIGVTVIAANGTAVTAYPAATFNPALPFREIEYFQLAMSTGKPAVGKPRIGRISHKPAIGFAAPIRGRDGRIIGVLAGFSLLEDSTLFGSVQKANAGKTGWIAVSSPAYRMIVSCSDPTRILEPVASPGVNLMFDKFVAGHEGSGVAINSKGIETLTSAKHVPTAGWIAQVVLPTEEAFAPIRNITRRTYAIALGLSLIVAMLTWLTIRHALQPLGETSRQIEEMAAEHAPLSTITVDRDDEIGALQKGFNLLVVAKNEAAAKIEAQRQYIADLSQHLLSAQEEERRRLALDLHDIVSPNLAAIKILLTMVTNELSRHQGQEHLLHMEDAQGLLQDTEASLRRIGADLRPTELDYSGLSAALESYAKQFTGRTGIRVDVAVSSTGERLPLELETNLFRIAQEALTNAAKHARPRSIQVQWQVSHDEGVLVIADDGIGFEASRLGNRSTSVGLGLLTMRERAEYVGGAFTLESDPGRGTIVRVRVGWSGQPSSAKHPVSFPATDSCTGVAA